MKYRTVLLLLVLLTVLSACGPPDEANLILNRLNRTIHERKTMDTQEVKKATVSGRIWKILVVHSYLNDYRWIKEIETGIVDRLNGKDYYGIKDPSRAIQYELKIFYMDTKNHPELSWKQRKGAEALALVKQYKPDLVIASDDNAQEYFAKHLKGTSLPIVFCGVNKAISLYGYLDSLQRLVPNVTGVTEDVNFYRTLRLAKTLVPGAKTAFILGDNSPTNQGVIENLIPFFGKAPMKILGYRLTNSWEGWKKEVRALKGVVDVAIYPHYHTIRDAQDRSVPHHEVLAWTLRNSKIPDFTFWNFGVIDGVLGSISVWGKAHGYESADIAIRILEGGEKPGDIPVRAPLVGTIILNRERAKMLGVQIPFSLMADAILVNEIGVFSPGG